MSKDRRPHDQHQTAGDQGAFWRAGVQINRKEGFAQIAEQNEQTAPEPAFFKGVEGAGIAVLGSQGGVFFENSAE
nr:hypothetical protein [Allobaculum sp. Allo2]